MFWVLQMMDLKSGWKFLHCPVIFMGRSMPWCLYLVLLAFQMQQVEICAVLVTCVSAAESSGGSSIATLYKQKFLFKVT